MGYPPSSTIGPGQGSVIGGSGGLSARADTDEQSRNAAVQRAVSVRVRGQSRQGPTGCLDIFAMVNTYQGCLRPSSLRTEVCINLVDVCAKSSTNLATGPVG